MNLLRQTLALAPLALTLIASPVIAQEEEEWEDDDPMVYEHLMDLDRHMRDLGEQLEGIDETLALDFTSNFLWKDHPCDEGEDCDVHIVINDGKRYVIVNGDTVESGYGTLPHHGQFAFKSGPRVHFKGYEPGEHIGRNFTRFFDDHRDPELRRMEREARDIARKARSADPDEKATLESELNRKLNEIFDYKLERQEESIRKAEDRLSKLKERRSKRESARDEIIRNRRDELLGRDQYLEW